MVKIDNLHANDVLKREEKRLEKLNAIFSHKIPTFKATSNTEAILGDAQERMRIDYKRLVKEMSEPTSSLNNELAQMWHTLFKRI